MPTPCNDDTEIALIDVCKRLVNLSTLVSSIRSSSSRPVHEKLETLINIIDFASEFTDTIISITAGTQEITSVAIDTQNTDDTPLNTGESSSSRGITKQRKGIRGGGQGIDSSALVGKKRGRKPNNLLKDKNTVDGDKSVLKRGRKSKKQAEQAEPIAHDTRAVVEKGGDRAQMEGKLDIETESTGSVDITNMFHNSGDETLHGGSDKYDMIKNNAITGLFSSKKKSEIIDSDTED
jgi:hypothetical protein